MTSSVTIIPAQPGFFAVDDFRDAGGRRHQPHLPVIAWAITPNEDGTVTVVPIGVDGMLDDGQPIYGPDGRPAHA